MKPVEAHLPYVDEHALTIAAPRAQVWAGLQRYVATTLAAPKHPVVAHALGTRPPAGFRVAETVPGERIALAGCHRFSDYVLVFELAGGAADATRLRATTYATFPGPHGRVYRVLVIGTRAHVLATRHMLRAIRRLAVAPGTAGWLSGH